MADVRGEPPGPYADLEVIRREAGMPISRFATIIGIPERTYRNWAARERRGTQDKGPWPTPAQDQVAEAVVDLAQKWPRWGHLRIAAALRGSGVPCSDSTVQRVMARNGLLNDARDGSQRRELEGLRRRALTPTPDRRNQVWVLDVGEVDTPSGAIWRLTGCADYATRYEFPWRLNESANRQDAVEALQLAIDDAERLLGMPLAEELARAEQPRRIRLVTDNRPAFKAKAFTGFVASTGLFDLVRVPSLPGNPELVERAFGPLAYEYLYQYDISDLDALASAAEEFREVFNWVRPNSRIDMGLPGPSYVNDAVMGSQETAPISP